MIMPNLNNNIHKTSPTESKEGKTPNVTYMSLSLDMAWYSMHLAMNTRYLPKYIHTSLFGFIANI